MTNLLVLTDFVALILPSIFPPVVTVAWVWIKQISPTCPLYNTERSYDHIMLTPRTGHFVLKPLVNCIFMAWESWRSNTKISTNQSTVSRRWTNRCRPRSCRSTCCVSSSCWSGSSPRPSGSPSLPPSPPAGRTGQRPAVAGSSQWSFNHWVEGLGKYSGGNLCGNFAYLFL